MTLSITELLSDGSPSDLDSYSLGSPSTTDGALLLLHVSAGLVDLSEAVDAITGTLGLTWEVVEVSAVPNNNVYSTVLATYGDGSTGTLVADFVSTHTNCVWRLYQVTGDSGTPTIRQSDFSTQATANPSVTLGSTLSDSLLVGFMSYNAGNAQTPGAGSVFTALGSKNTQNSPTNTNFGEYRQQDGSGNDTNVVAFTTSNASGSVVTGIEVEEVAGGTTYDGAVAMSATSTLTADATVLGTQSGEAALTATSTLTAAANLAPAVAAVVLSATSTLTANGTISSDMLFAEDFESVSDGADITTGNTGFTTVNKTGTGDAVGDTAYSILGSTSAEVTVSTAGDLAILEVQFTETDPVWVRFYFRPDFYMTPDPETETNIAEWRTTANVIRAMMEFTQDGYLNIKDGSILEDTSTTAIPLDQWSRIEWSVNGPANTQEARLFVGANLHGTTPDEVLTGAYTKDDGVSEFWLGSVRKTFPQHNWFDAVEIRGDGWVGPALTEWSATVAMTAAATLTTDGARTAEGAAALTATSTLVADGVRSAAGVVAMSAASTLTADVVRVVPTEAALSAVSALSTDGVREVAGAAVVSATSSLTADAVVIKVAEVMITATSTLTVAAFVGLEAAVAFTTASTLTTDAVKIGVQDAEAALVATSILTTDGVRATDAAVAIAAASTLTADAVRVVPADVALAATSTLSADGVRVVPAAVSLAATNTLVTDAVHTTYAQANLTAMATFSADGEVAGQATGDVALTATSTLSTGGVRETAALADLVATTMFTADAIRMAPADVAMISMSTLTTDGVRTAPAAADLTSASVFTASAVVTKWAEVTLTGSSTLAAESTPGTAASANLTATLTTAAGGVIERQGAAAFTATSDLAVLAFQVLFAEAALTTTATFSADGASVGQQAGEVALSAAATLLVDMIVTRLAGASMLGQGTLSVEATKVRTAAAALQTDHTTSVTAVPERTAAAVLSAVFNLTVNPTATFEGVSLLQSVSTLTALGVILALEDRDLKAYATMRPNHTWAYLRETV